MKALAIEALKTGSFERHEAVLHETAIDLPPGEAHEQGFVVHEYDCGILREAWFFIDTHRVPLFGDEIEAVLEARPLEQAAPLKNEREPLP